MLFECIPAPVKYYGSCFSSPESSNAIGILGILGILVTPQPALAGLLALTSSNPQSQRNEPKPKTPANPTAPHRTQPHTGWALGFDLFQPTKPTQRAKAQNSSPANPRSAQPLTCPVLRPTAASGRATPPPARPHRQIHAKAID